MTDQKHWHALLSYTQLLCSLLHVDMNTNMKQEMLMSWFNTINPTTGTYELSFSSWRDLI